MTLIIHRNIPLKDKNWFQTGGPASHFCEPRTAQEFQEALSYAQQHGLEIFVLGQGANILISDDGFDGLVIRPMIKDIVLPSLDTSSLRSDTSDFVKTTTDKRDDREKRSPQENDILVTAGAGVTMDELIEYCLNHQILGLEEFSGIPGTVGGSVYINLHYFEFLLEQFISSAQVIDKKTGHIMTVTPAWFAFGYDQSRLHDHAHFLINATFKLHTAPEFEVMYARGRRAEIIRHRIRRYPAIRTCGSFFRNFHEHEVSLISSGKKMIYAAYYLDKIGAKGHLQIGDAIVSHQHANMIVNKGHATSTDIIQLAHRMQELVHQQFGVVLQPECQLIGFTQWPLLT